MPRWCYAAWGLTTLLAFALPISIPYALWPPGGGPQADLVAECGRRAKNDAIQGTHPVASVWPLSVSVESCSREPGGVLQYRAEVTARGPYGLPFASARVTERDIGSLDADGGLTLGFSALLTGMVVVSMPFAYAWLHLRLQRRLQPSV